ncbi:MAG: DUF4355 domain-containing protein [Candidatus Shapirobacteria bacterium]|nr:DUF4355 domain-containing protein [Candidatus Shapirobacteria bacterium]
MPDDDKDKIVTPPVDDKDKKVDPPVDDKDKDKKGLSQEDVDKIIADRLTRAEESFQKKLSDERKKWEDDQKLSDKEKKEKEEKEREEARINKENDISLRENRLTLTEKMAEAKVPTVFADFLVNVNTDKTIENFNKFKTAWEKSLEDYLKGKISTETIKTDTQTKTEPTKSGNAVITNNGQAIL